MNTLMVDEKAFTDCPTILCCLCGIPIQPNSMNMCKNCMQNEVNIAQDINRQFVILQCRNCLNFLNNTKWIHCDLESKELLSLCLKKINRLQKVKLVDAKFLWTEPHCKRLKVKLTVQGESFNNTIVQQSFLVEYVIENKQCDKCQKSFTENTWTSCVQIRQRVSHKRSFFYLEQMILKNGMARNVTGLKEMPEGLNLYFESKAHAAQLINFLLTVVPIQRNHSKRLVSQDFKSNLTTYKYTVHVQIAPICREDLVFSKSKTISKKMGCDSPFLLCIKVTNQMTFLNPITHKKLCVTASEYFNNTFVPISNSRSLVEFIVLDVAFVKQKPPILKKHKLASIECVRKEDINNPSRFVECVSHLGHILRAGDLCLGYDLRTQNIDQSLYKDLPEVVLVRKTFDRARKRDWKLRRLARKQLEKKGELFEAEAVEMAGGEKDEKTALGGKKRGGKKRKAKGRKEGKDLMKNDEKEDEKRFIEELEECEEMRKNVDMWKINETGTEMEDESEENPAGFNLRVE